MSERQPCKNCGELYDPGDDSDLLWGVFVTGRYCGPCGAAEARLTVESWGEEP